MGLPSCFSHLWWECSYLSSLVSERHHSLWWESPLHWSQRGDETPLQETVLTKMTKWPQVRQTPDLLHARAAVNFCKWDGWRGSPCACSLDAVERFKAGWQKGRQREAVLSFLRGLQPGTWEHLPALQFHQQPLHTCNDVKEPVIITSFATTAPSFPLNHPTCGES